MVSNVKKLAKETKFSYTDSLHKIAITSLPNWLIDSIVLGKIDTAKNVYAAKNIVTDTTQNTNTTFADATIQQQPNPLPQSNTTTLEQTKMQQKNYTFSYAFGITLGNFLEFNNPISADKKSFSFTSSLDINYRYDKPTAFVTMTPVPISNALFRTKY